MEEFLFESYRGNSPQIRMSGPESSWVFWPEWASAFFTIRNWRGSLRDIPELWGVEPYPGIMPIIAQLANALTEAENWAKKRYHDWERGNRK